MLPPSESSRPARTRLLNAAAQLFYAHGIEATGIDTIIKQAGVARKSLYNNFASKRELVHAYIEERHQQWLVFYAQRQQQAQSPEQRIEAVFDAYADHAQSPLSPGFHGCGLLNAAAELGDDAEAMALIRGHKQEIEQLLEQQLERLLPHDHARAQQLAMRLAFLLEGGIVRSGLERNTAAIKTAKAWAMELVAAL